jgi:hypothetical protein
VKNNETLRGGRGRFSRVELAERSMYKRVEMNWARNTRHRFSLALVVSMLFCGLSSSEISELARLIDDTSNDFTLVVTTKTSASVIVKASSDSCASAVQQNNDAFEYQAPSRVSILYAYSPAGYLQLLCVHRT